MDSISRFPARIGCLLAIAVCLILPLRAADGDAPADMQQLDAPASKPAGQMLPLGDYGADDMGYLAIPATPPTVGIVLVPDAYGLDDFTKSEANRLAGEGYLVLAVDLYNGHLTTDPGAVANVTANIDSASAMKTVNAGIRLFNESPNFHADHVVVMGWGAGATFAFQAARDNKVLDGAILFYGPVLTQTAEIKKFAAPVCAVYPENDSVATHENVVAFQKMMKAAGNDFEAWFVAAGRGWSSPESKTHNAVEDREAWKVALPFLVRISAEPVKPKKDSIIEKAGSSLNKAKDSIEKIFQ